MEYHCPKCRTIVESAKKLEYCICGYKYNSCCTLETLEDLMGMAKPKKEKENG